MTLTKDLQDRIRAAWGSIPPPPAKDLQYMAWACGEESWRALAGIAPMDVDIHSRGFATAELLFEMPERATAAYLGTYLLAILQSIENEILDQYTGDAAIRGTTLATLTSAEFWSTVPHYLSPQCRDVLAEVVAFLASKRDLLCLTEAQTAFMQDRAEGVRPRPPKRYR